MSAPNIESSGDIFAVLNHNQNNIPGNLEVAGVSANGYNLVNPVANGATVNLSSTVTYNVLRPTSDSTISGAVINLPTVGLVDGQRCTVSSSAAITTVTGTISSAPVPVLAAMTAGQSVTYIYNLANTTWVRA